jgi:hypothetical protein
MYLGIHGVHGLILLIGDKLRDQSFANDTTLYLEGAIDNLK